MAEEGATTALAAMQAAAAAMQTARNELNTANTTVNNSTAGSALKASLHSALALVAGTLQTAEANANTWIAANGPVTPPPPVNPPPASGAPVVTGLSPSNAAAGTRIVVSGSGFTGTGTVAFGTVASTAWSVVSDTAISVVVPSGSGSVPVVVTNTHGPSSGGPQFTYAGSVTPPPVNPPPVNPPPVNPPPAGSQIVGINDHSLMWGNTTGFPVPGTPTTQLAAIKAKVFRNDLACDYGTSKTGEFGSAQCVSAVNAWATALRSINCQPMIVVTWATPQDTATVAAGMAAICKGTPGLWIEWGNELDYQDPGDVPTTYIPQFKAVVAAVHAADPTAKISPAPVANINSGGDGWNNDNAMFAAGLGSIPYDFLGFHCYPYPTGGSPASAEQYIAPFIAAAASWGNKAPCWLTECGWQTSDVSQATQALYCQQWLQSPAVAALPVVIFYELFDDAPGSQTYGWMTYQAQPKAVYTAFAAAG